MKKPKVEKRPCVSCGNLVPDHQLPPYPGHKRDCLLRAEWMEYNDRLPPNREQKKGAAGMLIIAAVLGECCSSPHLKIVEVSETDETRACTIAKALLQDPGDADLPAYDVGDIIALTTADLGPDFRVVRGKLAPVEE